MARRKTTSSLEAAPLALKASDAELLTFPVDHPGGYFDDTALEPPVSASFTATQDTVPGTDE